MGRYDDEVVAADVSPVVDTDDIDAAPEVKPEREKVSAEVQAKAGQVIRRGWGAADETRQADSPFAQKLKVENDKTILIKFIEDEPYASYRQHWIERDGQKSFTCLADIDPAGCPLCAAGHRPSARFAFNVVQLFTDSDPALRSYEIGPSIIDQLKNIHQDPRIGPLTKNYFAVLKTGKKSTSRTAHNPVKERDFADDWKGYTSLTPEQLAKFKASGYDFSIVGITPRKVLVGIAAEELGAD